MYFDSRMVLSDKNVLIFWRNPIIRILWSLGSDVFHSSLSFPIFFILFFLVLGQQNTQLEILICSSSCIMEKGQARIEFKVFFPCEAYSLQYNTMQLPIPLTVNTSLLKREMGKSIQGKTKPQRAAYAGPCPTQCPVHVLPLLLSEARGLNLSAATCRVFTPVSLLQLGMQERRTPGRKLLAITLPLFMRLNVGISHQGEEDSTPVKAEHQQ